MLDFFNTFEKYLSLLLEPTVALLIGILSIWISKNSNIYSASLERLNNAYHPIFLLAEPYLFKKVDRETAHKFIERYNKVEKDYSLYIYPSLRYRVHRLSAYLEIDPPESVDESMIDYEWDLICYLINKEYDRLCKKSHMPLRNINYRLKNNQFDSKISLYLGMFNLYVFPLLIFIGYIYVLIRYFTKIFF